MYNQLNKKLYISAIIFLLSSSVFVACNSKQEKIDDEATQEVSSATTSSTTTEWTVYKENTEATIANNDERIKTLREKIKQSNTPNLDKLREKRIDDLQEQNARLRAKIADYKEEEMRSNWEQFKADVQKQLDEIEASFKDLDKDDKK